MEQNYDFLKRFREIHQPGRRTVFRPAGSGEIEITSGWYLSIEPDSAAALRAVYDFQDYMQQSMGLSLPVRSKETDRRIIYFRKNPVFVKRGAFEVRVTEDCIEILGDDERGILRGGIYLEDLMNLAEGPYLKTGIFRKEPALRMRLVHSGSGIDDFPDWQLNAILHAGFTAIDLFVRDIDVNGRHEYCNINDLIERAESYGLDTILYNYMKCFKHPDDPDAEQCFDAIYGNLFRHYPQAAGITLVGETWNFRVMMNGAQGKDFQKVQSTVFRKLDPAPDGFHAGIIRRCFRKSFRVSTGSNLMRKSCSVPITGAIYLRKSGKDFWRNAPKN